jgi:hypothetical protein
MGAAVTTFLIAACGVAAPTISPSHSPLPTSTPSTTVPPTLAPSPTTPPTVPPTASPTSPPSAAYQPDGWIKLFFEDEFKGDDVYNDTGKQQTAVQEVVGDPPPGSVDEFHITIENDGAEDRFLVMASAGPSATFYEGAPAYEGGTDITEAVIGGGYETALLAQGERVLLFVEVEPYSDAIVITITSVSDPTKADTVRGEGTNCEC